MERNIHHLPSDMLVFFSRAFLPISKRDSGSRHSKPPPRPLRGPEEREVG